MSDENIKNAADATAIFCMPSADATVPDLMGSMRPGDPTLSILKRPQTGASFVLDTPEITIGRDPSSSVFLNDMTVSRRHAVLHINGNSARIEDLGSLNGTWVDGAIVNGAPLHDGSSVQIGTFTLIYHESTPERIETGE